MNLEKVSKFIKEIRKKYNLTQKELAEKYNVTYQAVSKWENAKNVPDISILKSMSKDFNVSLDDILDGELKKKDYKKIILVCTICCLFFLFSAFLIYKYFSNNINFNFKTLKTSCDNFEISGTISYNTKKSAIYISNIAYCGTKENDLYEQIECILYESDGNNDIEISSYKYKENDKISLEEFLKKVNFVIDNYSNKCKNYKENSLKLVIKAKEENKSVNYEIPLLLDDKCS